MIRLFKKRFTCFTDITLNRTVDNMPCYDALESFNPNTKYIYLNKKLAYSNSLLIDIIFLNIKIEGQRRFFIDKLEISANLMRVDKKVYKRRIYTIPE